MAWTLRMTAREIVAAALVVLSPAAYFAFSETSLGVLYQTSAGHGLLLITLPIGLVLVRFSEHRQSTPVWARLLLGAAAGLLLATALTIINSLSAGTTRELAGTSLGTSLESGAASGHAMIRLEDGRTIHLLNAFCGVNGSPVMIAHADGLLGLDRLLGCNLPTMRPPQSNAPETTPK